jgi:hypothetical protein
VDGTKYVPQNNGEKLTQLPVTNEEQGCVCYKVFNHLPQYIKALTNDQKCFKSTLKRILYHHSFYSMNEYHEYKEEDR